MNMLPIQLLKPHPKNNEYYDDLAGEKYEEVKRSIEMHGIRDPLKVTLDYTVVAGHQRLRIANELGIEKVPVVILDISPEEAEYLLIADNEERRQVDNDPIKKARRAKFLKEYWGVNHGGSRRQNGDLKTTDDIAEAIGENRRTTERLIKLNDLIPELQSLVSSGKLGTTAAEQLAYLSPQAQRAIWNTLGEEIGAKTVAEAKEIRKRLEAAEQALAEAQAQAKAEAERASELEHKLSEILNRPAPEPKVIEKIVEKPIEVIPDHIQARIQELEAALGDLEQHKTQVKNYQQQKKQLLNDIGALMEKVRKLREEDQEIMSAAAFVLTVDKATKSLEQNKVKIERFARSGIVLPAVYASQIRMNIDLLYEVAELLDNATKTIDISNIS